MEDGDVLEAPVPVPVFVLIKFGHDNIKIRLMRDGYSSPDDGAENPDLQPPCPRSRFTLIGQCQETQMMSRSCR